MLDIAIAISWDNIGQTTIQIFFLKIRVIFKIPDFFFKVLFLSKELLNSTANAGYFSSSFIIPINIFKIYFQKKIMKSFTFVCFCPISFLDHTLVQVQEETLFSLVMK